MLTRQVHLHGVTNLEPYQSTFTRSDPYVRLILTLPGDRGKAEKSNKVINTTNPVWDPPFVFDYSFDLPGASLIVEVLDVS